MPQRVWAAPLEGSLTVTITRTAPTCQLTPLRRSPPPYQHGGRRVHPAVRKTTHSPDCPPRTPLVGWCCQENRRRSPAGRLALADAPVEDGYLRVPPGPRQSGALPADVIRDHQQQAAGEGAPAQRRAFRRAVSPLTKLAPGRLLRRRN